MVVFGWALASDIVRDTDTYSRRANIVTMELDAVLDETQVIVEGPVIDERVDVWLETTGLSGARIVRMSVENELFGHVASGVVEFELSDDWVQPLDVGQRVMVFLGYKGCPYSRTLATRGLPEWAPFNDLLTTAVPGTFYMRYIKNEGNQDGIPEEDTIDFSLAQALSGRYVPWVYTGRIVDGKHEFHTWQGAMETLRAHVAATGRVGSTISGVTP